MILLLDGIRDERGVTLIAAIILLFFISHFLFSIKLWHDSQYRNYSSLEMYYEKKVLQYLINSVDESEADIEESSEEVIDFLDVEV